VDLPGHYLMPGLIDSHQHLCFDPTAEDCVGLLEAQDDRELLAAMTTRAQRAARRGVTTIRDLGDRGYLAVQLAASGDPEIPAILAAGPPLTSPGGHCHFLGGEIGDAGQALDAVAEHCARGSDLIKIMINGGILTSSSDPGQMQFGEETVRAVVAAAHERGRLVAAHAHTWAGIELALRCGVDTIEHATFASETQFRYDAKVAAAIAGSSAWVCPTVVAPPGVSWQPEHYGWRGSVLARLHRAGVRLAAGTDAGVKQGLDHASAGWVVAAYVAAGVPVLDALVAVTYGAAQACGVAHRKGLLAPGWDADVIAVRGNPLADPLATTEPALVLNRGHLLAAAV
jgi:imidazolonepropionase-like amidohydrolase